MIDEWVGLHVAGIFFNSPLLTNKNMLPIVTDKSEDMTKNHYCQSKR